MTLINNVKVGFCFLKLLKFHAGRRAFCFLEVLSPSELGGYVINPDCCQFHKYNT